jgi:signal peptidase II
MARPVLPKWGLLIAAAIFLLDRITKYVMVEKVMRPEGVTDTPYFTERTITVLPVLDLRMAWNYGISFSLFNSGSDGMVMALLAVQVLITAGLCWYMWRLDGILMQVAAGLIVGGALGNILDRAVYGAVADFLDFHWGDLHFPTFNLADSCISIGVALWLLDAVRAASHHAAAPQGPPKD